MWISSIIVFERTARHGRNDLQTRRLSQALLCLFAGWFGAVSPVFAAPLVIAPHRAAYTFEMISSEPGSGISNVSGGMTFEWADACDGWSLDQRHYLLIARQDGSQMAIRSSNVTWESKDGLRYRFNIKRGRDEAVTEVLSGEAHLDAAGAAGLATFTKPKEEKFPLEAGTKFPTDLVLSQLRAAQKGARLQRNLVFEGSAAEGAQPVATIILPRRAARQAGLLKEPLGPHDVWPMHIAYYPIKNPDGIPETEISIEMQANGIVPAFVIDYGSFKFRATLARIKALDKSGC